MEWIYHGMVLIAIGTILTLRKIHSLQISKCKIYKCSVTSIENMEQTNWDIEE